MLPDVSAFDVVLAAYVLIGAVVLLRQFFDGSFRQ